MLYKKASSPWKLFSRFQRKQHKTPLRKRDRTTKKFAQKQKTALLEIQNFVETNQRTKDVLCSQKAFGVKNKFLPNFLSQSKWGRREQNNVIFSDWLEFFVKRKDNDSRFTLLGIQSLHANRWINFVTLWISRKQKQLTSFVF